jgi:hypothetical protein
MEFRHWRSGLVQTKGDGTHVMLPATTHVTVRPDRMGLPVMMLRHADGKVHRDGYPAAKVQRSCAVDERGRLHGVSGLATIAERGVAACVRASCRSKEKVDDGYESR